MAIEVGSNDDCGEHVNWETENKDEVEISMYAIDGSRSTNTIKIREVDKKLVMILADSEWPKN